MPKTVKLSSRPAFARRIPDATSSDSPRVCVSTYLLDPSSDTRSGSLCILKAEKNQNLVLENEISTSAGVFRFDFRNPSTVVAALTDGSLVVQQIEEPTSSETTPVSSDMLLDLGLSNSSLTITTDNKGHAYLVDLNTSLIVATWLAHSLPYVPGEGCEVWSCSVTPDAQTVVTGGEDGSMKLWDARSKTQISQSKIFGAGVVFVDFPAENRAENQIFTGSYDENLRVFDRRNLKTVLKEKKLSGGVWNIEHDDEQLCVSCMYGGYSILNSESLDVIYENREVGKNLLYGATKISKNSTIFYSTQFVSTRSDADNGNDPSADFNFSSNIVAKPMDSPGINRREGSEGRTEGWDGTSSGRQQDRGGMKWINDSSTRIRVEDGSIMDG